MMMMNILTSPSPLLPALSIHILLTFHLHLLPSFISLYPYCYHQYSSKKSPFMNTSHGDSSELGSMHDAPMAISKGNHHSTIGAISNKDDIPSLSSKQEDTPMLGGIGLREPIRFPTQQRDRNSDPEIHPQMEFTTSTTSASYNQELDQYALQKAVGPDSTKSSLKGVECHETGRDDFATIGYGNSSGDGSHDGQSRYVTPESFFIIIMMTVMMPRDDDDEYANLCLSSLLPALSIHILLTFHLLLLLLPTLSHYTLITTTIVMAIVTAAVRVDPVQPRCVALR